MMGRLTDKPIISVIIPVYNCEKYIAQAIESVLNQPFHQMEIICIDDGSSDSSYQIMTRYSEMDDRVYAVHQDNTGVSATRNKGIILAQGNYVCFLDADDMWVPDFLTEEIVGQWEKSEFDVISYKEVCTNENATAFSISISRESKVICGGASSIWCVSSHMGGCFYKRELLLEYKIIFAEKMKYGEDGLFRLCCMYFANKICIEDKDMYIYRQVRTSVMHQRKQSAIDYYMQIVEGYVQLENFCNSFELSEKGKVKIAKSAIGVYYIDMAKEHFENSGSIKALKHALLSSDNYEKFCSLNKEEVSEKYWKDYQKFRNNIIGFKIKYYFKGVFLKVLLICLRIPSVRKIREKQLYQRKNLL